MTTAEVPRTMARPEVGTMFMAYRQDLRLVLEPRYPVRGPDGRQVGEKPGLTVRFRDGVLRLPSEGMVEAEDGTLHPVARVLELIEGDGDMRAPHRLLGHTYEGFWRVDPVAPPVSPEEMDALTTAATSLDVAGLERMLEEERAGWNREAVVGVAERALERVREASAALETEARAAVDRAREEGRAAALKEAQAGKAPAKGQAKPDDDKG